jgi:pentatricopeptide repeat protein
MIRSRTKAINQTQPIVIRDYINHFHSQTYRTARHSKPKTKHRHEQRPHRPTVRPRKPIPFVTSVKEVLDPDDALSLFHEYHQMGFKHDYPSYSSLVYKLARSRNFEAVETILGLIQDRDIRCRETLFIALIQHYGKAHLVDKAIELFHRMPSFNCVRTLQSLNALLNALVDNDRFSDANEIFDRSSKMGFRPNSVSFNVMIKGWLRKDEWEQACKLFDQMLERNEQPSVVTYNSLIGFLSRKGYLDKAMSLLEDMTQKGKYPNSVTYALLMEGLCSV